MYLLTTREFYFFCWKNLYCVYNVMHVFIILCFYNIIVRFSVKQDYATAVLLRINIIFIDRAPGPHENHSSGMDQFVFQRTGHAQDLRLFRAHHTRRGLHNLSSTVCDTASAVAKMIFKAVFSFFTTLHCFRFGASNRSTSMSGGQAVAPARPWPASMPDVRGSSAGISANDYLR